MLTMKPTLTQTAVHYVVLYMSMCYSQCVFLDISKPKLLIYEDFLSGSGENHIINRSVCLSN